MTDEDWTRTEHAQPPENLVVDTMDSSGKVSQLKRIRNLWWFPDGSMYVYYTPIMWKFKS